MTHFGIYVALGANLPSAAGPPLATLRAALALLGAHGCRITARSSWYRTPAVGPPGQADYVNGVVSLATALPPAALLAQLHRIEARFGRARAMRWGPRVLDLDLIDYQGLVIGGDGDGDRGTATRSLILPHPEVSARAFVLLPLRDVAPAWRHPRSGTPVDRLLGDLDRREIGRCVNLSG